MAEDLDVEALLEAPFRKGEEVPAKPRENGVSSHKSSGKSKHRSRSRSRDRGEKSSRREDKARDKERRPRSRSRERKKEKDGEKERKRGASREKERDGKRRRSRERERSGRRSRSKSKERRHHRHSSPHGPSRRERFGHHRKGSPSPIGLVSPKRHILETSLDVRDEVQQANGKPRRPDELSPEERDARTVFCMQLSARVRGRDLEEFFSAVGKVRDVRLITCNKTRRFKGIAYVEFKDPDAVPLAMGLSGQKLLGVPIIVQHTQAEKNRAGSSTVGGSSASAAAAAAQKGVGAGGLGVAGGLGASVLGGLGGGLGGSGVGVGGGGPMRLYVGSLHFNITEDMLRGIFEPFGKIDNIQLIMDPETGRSKGYGFITVLIAASIANSFHLTMKFYILGCLFYTFLIVCLGLFDSLCNRLLTRPANTFLEMYEISDGNLC